MTTQYFYHLKPIADRSNVATLGTIAHAHVNQTEKNFKIRRAGTNSAYVVLIIDESSSMQNKIVETVTGVKNLIANHDDNKTVTRVFGFNGWETYEKIHFTMASSSLPIQIRAQGNTNLNDSIAYVINEISNDLKKKYLKSLRPSVEIIIITDGEENSSKNFTHDEVKELIKKAEQKEWTFTFVGCDYDVKNDANILGLSRNFSFSKENAASAYADLVTSSLTTKAMRATGESVASIYAATKDILSDKL